MLPPLSAIQFHRNSIFCLSETSSFGEMQLEAKIVSLNSSTLNRVPNRHLAPITCHESYSIEVFYYHKVIFHACDLPIYKLYPNIHGTCLHIGLLSDFPNFSIRLVSSIESPPIFTMTSVMIDSGSRLIALILKII